MTNLAFDTLKYATDLEHTGVPKKQAKMQAIALKKMVDDQLASKNDIKLVRKDIKFIKKDIVFIKKDVTSVKNDITSVKNDITFIKKDILGLEDRLNTNMSKLEDRLKQDMLVLEDRLKRDIAEMGLKMTIKLGGFIVTAVVILTAIIKL